MLDPYANLRVEDLPNEDLRWLAEDIGLETVLLLMRSFRGIDLYVPSKEGFSIPTTIEEMPNSSMAIVARDCGVPVAVSLLRNAPGTRFHLPFPASCAWAKRWVRKNFDGKNALELAVALGVSSHFVYEIVADMRPEKVAAKWRRRKLGARALAEESEPDQMEKQNRNNGPSRNSGPAGPNHTHNQQLERKSSWVQNEKYS